MHKAPNLANAVPPNEASISGINRQGVGWMSHCPGVGCPFFGSAPVSTASLGTHPSEPSTPHSLSTNYGESLIILCCRSSSILGFWCLSITNRNIYYKLKTTQKDGNQSAPTRGRNGKINGPTEINVPARKPLVGKIKGRSGLRVGNFGPFRLPRIKRHVGPNSPICQVRAYVAFEPKTSWGFGGA